MKSSRKRYIILSASVVITFTLSKNMLSKNMLSKNLLGAKEDSKEVDCFRQIQPKPIEGKANSVNIIAPKIIYFNHQTVLLQA